MANIFNSVKIRRPDSNVFDLSYDHKLSFNMGELIPVHCQEIIPGDQQVQSSEAMLRLAPMLAPVMHKVDVYTHSFFVPNRLVWDNWEDFITGAQDGTAEGPAFPTFGNIVVGVGSLADHLGLPNSSGGIDKVSAIPFAAYNLIYNEYYRDQNLIAPVPYKLIDGDQVITGYNEIKKRAWQHDYFTSSLPFAQKGGAVDVPLGEVALKSGWDTSVNTPVFVDGAGIAPNGALSNVSPGPPAEIHAGTTPVAYDPGDSLTVTPTTINDLRKAYSLQAWLEKNARAGTRYVESILSHFGVKSSDARLQRPEYLGGTKAPMVISEVLQTSETEASPQGNMAGHGISVNGGKEFKYYSEEHGYIITIMSVLPRTAYQQGIPRHFSKFDRFKYFWPDFAHIGEQEVLNREVYYSNGVPVENDQVFGYVPRYAEYRYNDSRVSGDFKSTLSYWHMGRIFFSRPHLNEDFINSDPTHRIFAVTDPDEDKIYCHVFHHIKCRRKIPKYGTPTF